MSALTRWVLSHQRMVILFWVVVAVVGIATAGKATKSFDQRFSVPHREGWETSHFIASRYHTGGETLPLMPTVTLPAGKTVDSPGVRAQLAALDAKAAAAVPHARVASYASTGDRAFVSKDGRTAFSIVYAVPPKTTFGDDTKSIANLRRALVGAKVAGAPVRVTGFDALTKDTGGSNQGPGILLEILLGGLGALAVLAFVFA